MSELLNKKGEKSFSKERYLLLGTFFVAMLLTLLPFPYWAKAFHPDWVLLVLMYWVLESPGKIGVAVAWVLGFLLDVLMGTLLGEHALALSLVAYFCIVFRSRIQSLFFMRKMLAVFLLILLYKSVLFWIQGLIGQLPSSIGLYWLSALITLLVYPWVFILLNSYRDCEG